MITNIVENFLTASQVPNIDALMSSEDSDSASGSSEYFSPGHDNGIAAPYNFSFS